MAGQRKASKKRVGFWAEPEEVERIKALAASLGLDVTTLLRSIARGEFDVAKKTKKPPERG